MLCNFDTREQYMEFLDNLMRFCDRVDIIDPDEKVAAVKQFLEDVALYISDSRWRKKRKIYSLTAGGELTTGRELAADRELADVFKSADSFLNVGYDEEEGIGIDMKFYKNDKLVLEVINHEELVYLEEWCADEFKQCS